MRGRRRAGGKYARLDLRARYGEAELPDMAAIDLRGEEMPGSRWISPTLARAVELAAGAARPGEVVLLSPACASYDQFSDYEARGDAFIGAVQELSA